MGVPIMSEGWADSEDVVEGRKKEDKDAKKEEEEGRGAGVVTGWRWC